MPKEEQYIRIKGNLVQMLKTKVEREVSTEDFITGLSAECGFETGLLPTNCILYRRSKHDSIAGVQKVGYVLETRPGVQVIRYKDALSREEGVGHNLRLSLPHILWLIVCTDQIIHHLFVACAIDKITATHDILYKLPLPNINPGSGEVCLGDISVDKGLLFHERLGAIVEAVMASEWNRDYSPDYTQAGLGIESLFDWRDKTVANKDFYKELDYKEHKTFGEWLDCYVGTV